MTKDDFRKYATAAMNTLLDIPDELFEATAPVARIHIRGKGEAVIVGIELPYDDQDEDDC